MFGQRLVSALARVVSGRALAQSTGLGCVRASATGLQQCACNALTEDCSIPGFFPGFNSQQHFSSHAAASYSPRHQATILQILGRAPPGIKEALSFAHAKFEACVPPLDSEKLNFYLYALPGPVRKVLQKGAKKLKGAAKDEWLWQQMIAYAKLDQGMHGVWMIPLKDLSARSLLEWPEGYNVYYGEGPDRGMFASRDVEAGTVLAQVIGEGSFDLDDDELPPDAIPLLANDHSMIDTKQNLDVEARNYIINSCTIANTALCTVGHEGFLVATRDLLKDEELFRSYSMSWWLERSLVDSLNAVLLKVQNRGLDSPEVESAFKSYCEERLALESVCRRYHSFERLAQVFVGSLPQSEVEILRPLPEGWTEIENLRSIVVPHARSHRIFGPLIDDPWA
jgi:hypothetical protein